MRTLICSLTLGLASVAAGSPPLIYEGVLTADGAAPDPWPALRFTMVNNEGAPLWSFVVDETGPIEVASDGRFVAYLDTEAGADGPLLPEVVRADARLRIDVCLARENQSDCHWLPLEVPQPIGAVPLAIRGHLPPPGPEQFVLEPRLQPFGEDENPWPSTEAQAVAPATGLYLISASYSCRSTCDGPRSPTEVLYIDHQRDTRREGGDPADPIDERAPDNKKCNVTDGFEEKVFLPILRQLGEGDTVRFIALGWSCVQYRYANLSLSPLSVD